MPWKSGDKYRSLLRINNAIINQGTRDSLFKAMAVEIKKVFHYDRFSIQLYDMENNSLSYFATAEGVKPDGISCETSRPLPKGSVANLVIESRRPVIIKDLSKHPKLTTAEAMLKEGLRSTIALPLIMRDELLGSIHFSFKKSPPEIEKLPGFLEELSVQITIAIDNMLTYDKLEAMNKRLWKEKEYLFERFDKQNREFYYTSPAMTELMRDVELVADTNTSVLLSGETGTGKDHIARHIHNLSSRRDHLFVKVNCAALAPTLIESELFGHAKGSFTGASAKRRGRFETADGGTVFLDEIGELPLPSQSKLLQVLEERAFERVGESMPISVDFRTIAATNQDLMPKVRKGTFRRDLYYRLNTVHIWIPPLRERAEDILLLVRSFTSRLAEALCRYPWPGNVRELQNVIERVTILRGGHTINETDIDHMLHSFESTEKNGEERGFLTRYEMERKHIERALAKCGGVIGGKYGAARLLGIPRSTLQYRIKKLGIDHTSERSL
jgi:transcriptional regulator with GAF, ATPase, and Fis domain